MLHEIELSTITYVILDVLKDEYLTIDLRHWTPYFRGACKFDSMEEAITWLMMDNGAVADKWATIQPIMFN